MIPIKDNYKKRMVIDYLLIINKYTQLNAYPLSKINIMVNGIAKYHGILYFRRSHREPVKQDYGHWECSQFLLESWQWQLNPFTQRSNV